MFSDVRLDCCPAIHSSASDYLGLHAEYTTVFDSSRTSFGFDRSGIRAVVFSLLVDLRRRCGARSNYENQRKSVLMNSQYLFGLVLALSCVGMIAVFYSLEGAVGIAFVVVPFAVLVSLLYIVLISGKNSFLSAVIVFRVDHQVVLRVVLHNVRSVQARGRTSVFRYGTAARYYFNAA